MGGPDIAESVKRRFVQVNSIDELDQVLAQSSQPVMLDFYADWCVSCIEMERFTFSDPGVARKLDSLLLVQADVTRNDAEHRALLKRFRLFGPPGIIFFDAQGRELDIRVVGFQNAERFGRALDQVLAVSAAAPAGPGPAGSGAASAASATGVPEPAGADAPASEESALLSQQLRGFQGEIGQDTVAAGSLERQQ